MRTGKLDVVPESIMRGHSACECKNQLPAAGRGPGYNFGNRNPEQKEEGRCSTTAVGLAMPCGGKQGVSVLHVHHKPRDKDGELSSVHYRAEPILRKGLSTGDSYSILYFHDPE